MYNPAFSGLSTQERQIISHFSALELTTLNVDDLIKLHPCARATAHKILSRLASKGWLQRLKQGTYSIVPLSSSTSTPVIENAWPMAMDLFRPAFISGWSAAEHWDLTEQIFNSVSVVTAVPQRESIRVIGNIKFRTRTVARKAFFGTKTIWFGSKSVEVADPSRTLIDILDLPRFGGGGQHVVDIVRQYWQSTVRDPDLLLAYALRYKRGAVFKRLGYLAEIFNAPVSKAWFESCYQNVSAGISNLDPDGSKSGRIISTWNLRINMPV